MVAVNAAKIRDGYQLYLSLGCYLLDGVLSRPSFSGITPLQLITASASVRNALVIWEEKLSVSSKIDLVILQNLVPISCFKQR
jgi:hypothetical protein